MFLPRPSGADRVDGSLRLPRTPSPRTPGERPQGTSGKSGHTTATWSSGVPGRDLDVFPFVTTNTWVLSNFSVFDDPTLSPVLSLGLRYSPGRDVNGGTFFCRWCPLPPTGVTGGERGEVGLQGLLVARDESPLDPDPGCRRPEGNFSRRILHLSRIVGVI